MSILSTDTFADLGADPIGEAWRTAWTLPDRRPTKDWAGQYVDLQGDYANKGLFSYADSRYLEFPLDLFDDDGVRMINILKAVQTFGTGVCDIVLQRIFAERPGPLMWTFQTDDDALKHYLTRIKSTFEASALNSPRFGRLRKIRDLFQFPHMNAYFQGANMNSLQGKSMMYEINDEVWRWGKKLLDEAWARTDAFRRICKIFNISQGGLTSTDWEVCWNDGRRHDWGICCQNPTCQHLQPLEFFARRLDDPEARAGIIWADDCRRPDGTVDLARVEASTRYRCVKCGHDHPDTPRTWSLFNRSGQYICRETDLGRSRKNTSLRWNSLVRGPWSDLVAEFLRAKSLQDQGSTAKLEAFYQKKLAQFWDPTMAVQKIALTTTDYAQPDWTARDYKPAKIEHEKIRFITADYQQGAGDEGRHFWVCARAWRTKGKGSRLLWFGKLRTFQQIRDLQLALGVSSPAVCIDGGFEMMQVAAACAPYKWTMLVGDDVEDWSHRITHGRSTRRIRRPFSPKDWCDPYKGTTTAGRTGCARFWWSNPAVKNILWNLRHGNAKSPWELPIDLSPEYRHQIDSEHKKRFINKKTGAVEYLWVKYKTDNHAWDCEAMQVVCALIAGLIDYDFDKLDDAARAKNSFESTAPAIETPAEPTSTATDEAPPSASQHAPGGPPVAPHDQPQQLNLL